VTFKVYKTPVKRWFKKNKIEMVNAIATQINPTKIEISSIEKDRNGFTRKKLKI
jgi:tRNA A37 threonylcarbamoyladenosine dehydratase